MNDKIPCPGNRVVVIGLELTVCSPLVLLLPSQLFTVRNRVGWQQMLL